MSAQTWASNAGAGIVQPHAVANLSDFLPNVPRRHAGPFRMKVLRIGKHRDGSKVGIYIYCQEHAREWVTPLTCYELAKRLTENYATDAETKEFVDNLDIFIVPSINPDGSHVSFYDDSGSAGTSRTTAHPAPRTRCPRPQQLGRRPEPQQLAVHALRRVLRSVLELHE